MPEPGRGAIQLACLDAGGREVAIAVHEIREIVRDAQATPLPDAPALIEGVVELDGRMLPLLDLGRALGAAATPPGGGARIAVVEADGLALALRVGAALDVIEVEPERITTVAGPDAANPVRALVSRPDAAPLAWIGVAGLAGRLRSEAGAPDHDEDEGAPHELARNESELSMGDAR